MPDPTTLADAQAIVARHRLELPQTVARALADRSNESPKPGDPAFATAEFKLIARPADAFRALRQNARQTILERYDRDTVCLPKLIAMIEGLCAQKP